MNRIIGIDPGTRYTGIGIIEKQGSKLKFIHSETINTAKEKSLEEKLLIIFNKISELLELYTPNSASIERVFHSVNPHSSLILGHARGVSMLAVSKAQIAISEYAPTAVKSAVTGVGRASKDQVNTMVKILLNLDRSKVIREDESDALAIAICHANSQSYTDSKLKTLNLKG